MIRVLVRYENAIEVVLALTNGIEPRGDFLTAQPDIDQNPSTLGGDEGRITGTSACKDADLDDSVLLTILNFLGAKNNRVLQNDFCGGARCNDNIRAVHGEYRREHAQRTRRGDRLTVRLRKLFQAGM